MRIEEMKEIKKRNGYTNDDIASMTGVPLGTIQKIFAGVTKNPRRETLITLEKVFRQIADKESRTLRERPLQYKAEKKPGDYTIEDWYSLPGDRHAELIDGQFYDLAEPSREHQFILAEVYYLMREYLREHECNCLPEIAPVGVQLNKDDRNVFEPDLVVTCSEEQRGGRTIFGAPDMIMEILSPSNRRHDLVFKLQKYLEAGVREYWIVDPEKQRVYAYCFEEDVQLETYSFDEQVPVGISGGEFRVDFAEIRRSYDRYFPNQKVSKAGV